jgi:EAL domain-containing protein (putative c-di-GMP-specific phosphodiesterase class I)
MQHATVLYDAMLEGRISLAVQPVVDIQSMHVQLYGECLARLCGPDGSNVSPGNFVPALERLNLCRHFDQFMVRRVIGLLRRNPSMSLAVNVSGQSVRHDVLWAATLLDLASELEIARRLVIEITETAPVPLSKGRMLIARLRRLGCRIAIDDFGAGYGVQTGMEIDTPDIIKIDGSVLRRARQGGRDFRRLQKLVALASNMATSVVIEGVESRSDLELARDVGARWVQGQHVGSPEPVTF